MAVEIRTIFLSREDTLAAFRNMLNHGHDFLPTPALGVIRHALTDDPLVTFEHLEQEVLSEAMMEIVHEDRCQPPELVQNAAGFVFSLYSLARYGSVSMTISRHGSFITVRHPRPRTVYEWGQDLNLPNSWKVDGLAAGVPLRVAVYEPDKYRESEQVRVWDGGSHTDGGCL